MIASTCINMKSRRVEGKGYIESVVVTHDSRTLNLSLLMEKLVLFKEQPLKRKEKPILIMRDRSHSFSSHCTIVLLEVQIARQSRCSSSKTTPLQIQLYFVTRHRFCCLEKMRSVSVLILGTFLICLVSCLPSKRSSTSTQQVRKWIEEILYLRCVSLTSWRNVQKTRFVVTFN